MTGKNSNATLKDFIYIDKDRMYSLYSQLFEGVVESMVESVSYVNEGVNKEKKLEETIIDASVKTQNVILFDHIYNMLEEKLSDQMLIVDDKTPLSSISPSSIIKVTGYAIIEDYEHLTYLMKNYNDIGMAFATIEVKTPSNNKDTTSNNIANSKNSIEQYAKSKGLVLDKKFTESVVKILENLHGNSMELTVVANIEKNDVDFKALLEERYLRTSSNIIRTLYGYKPCMKWTLVGEVTNINWFFDVNNIEDKNKFADMFKGLSDVDASFWTKNPSEGKSVRVAPIAIYIDHSI